MSHVLSLAAEEQGRDGGDGHHNLIAVVAGHVGTVFLHLGQLAADEDPVHCPQRHMGTEFRF